MYECELYEYAGVTDGFEPSLPSGNRIQVHSKSNKFPYPLSDLSSSRVFSKEKAVIVHGVVILSLSI